MPSKQEVLDSIECRNYTQSEVSHLVRGVKTSSEEYKVQVPSKVKSGDIFLANGGSKKRPYVVISVREKQGIAITVPLTTTNDELALTPYTSRFLRGGWLTNQLVTVKLSYILENFGGVIENRAVIRQFKRDIKKFYKGLI